MWGRGEGEDREMYLFIKRNIFTPLGHPLPHFPTFCTFNAEQTSDITFSHPPPLGKAWNRRPRSGYSLSADYETWLLNGDRGGRIKLEAASLGERLQLMDDSGGKQTGGITFDPWYIIVVPRQGHISIQFLHSDDLYSVLHKGGGLEEETRLWTV